MNGDVIIMDEKTQLSHVYSSSPTKREAQTVGRMIKAEGMMRNTQIDSDFQDSLDASLRDALFAKPLPWASLAWKRRQSLAGWIPMLLCMSTALIGLSTAAFVTFDNCLSPNIIDSDPRQLQFKPLFVRAIFNATAPSHNLNVTVYGNVSGSATNEPLPRLGDPDWNNANETLGKIPELDIANNKYTTLKAAFKVLDYTPYTADPVPFCSRLLQGQCPLGPSFYANG